MLEGCCPHQSETPHNSAISDVLITCSARNFFFYSCLFVWLVEVHSPGSYSFFFFVCDGRSLPLALLLILFTSSLFFGRTFFNLLLTLLYCLFLFCLLYCPCCCYCLTWGLSFTLSLLFLAMT